MRNHIIAATLLAAATAVHGQTPEWQFYQDAKATNGLLIAFVQAKDGTQLMLKCDKPGKRSVYAVLVAKEKLARPRARFTMRPISLRYDGGEVNDDRWRYFENMATAVNRPGEASLTRLLGKLADAKQLEVQFHPEDKVVPDYISFDVHDARDAVAQVYKSCKDKNPLDESG